MAKPITPTPVGIPSPTTHITKSSKKFRILDIRDAINQKPVSLNPICILRPNKLMDISMLASDAVFIEDNLKSRIRRITHLDDLDQERRHELVRASRMLYELSIIQPDGTRVLSSLDKEEANIILNFPDHWSVIRLKNLIVSLFSEIRESGPVSPIEADLMSKDFVDIMES